MNDDENDKWKQRFISLVLVIMLVVGGILSQDNHYYSDSSNAMRVYGY